MKRLMAIALALPVGLWLIPSQVKAAPAQNTSVIHNDSGSDDCRESLRVGGDDFRSTFRDEETQTVPNQPLTITAEHNGGIRVTTWDQPNFSLKLCKEVAADDESVGRQVLAETKLQISGGTVTVSAPDHSNDHALGTSLLVKAPRGAQLSMSVHNGGISLTNFNGTADAHAHNGGISFRRSSGTLRAEAQNGGISIKECSGDVSAEVQNGGLHLVLPQRWEGKGLEAHTRNGGLSISVPRNFQSSLEVSASEHVPIQCRGSICDNAQRTWDDRSKIMRFGTGSPQIHATTVNGGVMVKEAGTGEGEL